MFGSRGASAVKAANVDPSQLSRADKMVLFGSMMRDMGSGLSGQQGDAMMQAQALMAARQQEAQRADWAQKIRTIMQPTQGPDVPAPPVTNQQGQDISAGFGPQAATPGAMRGPSLESLLPLLSDGALNGYKGASEIGALAKDAQPKAPSHIEGPDGIYEQDQGAPGGWRKVQSYPTRPNTTPGQVNPATGKWEWAPGYLESQQALTGVRRDAVVARPMPSHGKASAHSASSIKWD